MATAGLVCIDCHGNMAAVGSSSREPWSDLPLCQSCHTGDALNSFDGAIVRNLAYADGPSTATPIVAPNERFAEEAGRLYRNSRGHGGMACASCHGSPHAEWPTSEPNDNLTAVELQGHDGPIIECRTCHGDGLPLTLDGPHGLHNVNNTRWVKDHKQWFGGNQDACRSCHGLQGEGTVLSKAAADRMFQDKEGAWIQVPDGTPIDCGLCHENKL